MARKTAHRLPMSTVNIFTSSNYPALTARCRSTARIIVYLSS